MTTALGALHLPLLPRAGGPALAANYRIHTAFDCTSRLQSAPVLKASVLRHGRVSQSTYRSSAAPVAITALSNEFVEQVTGARSSVDCFLVSEIKCSCLFPVYELLCDKPSCDKHRVIYQPIYLSSLSSLHAMNSFW